MPDRTYSTESRAQTSDAGITAEICHMLKPYFALRRFKDGELLWREGDTEGMLVSLVEGRVKIYRLLPEGNATTNYIFGPDDLFGFMPLFDDAPYPAYAQAIGDVRARIVTKAKLHAAIRQNPDLALLLLKQLSRRLREAFEHVDVLTVRGVARKVAMALTSLFTDTPDCDGTGIVTLPVVSGEFAGLYGLTPESFSRGITRLVDDGVILRLGNNSFQILKPDILRRLARPELL